VAERLRQLQLQGHDGPSVRSRRRLYVTASAGRLRARLYERGVVKAEWLSERGGWLLDVELWDDEWESLVRDAAGTAVADEPLEAVSGA